MPKSRRGRGEGSIRQRSDGLWVVQLGLGVVTGPDGKKRRLRPTRYAKTKAEAQKALQELQVQTGKVAYSDEHTATYLHRFLEHAKTSVRVNTWTQYDYVLNKYVIPAVGAVRLKDLAPIHVQTMLKNMEKGGASPRLRQLARAVLSKALNDAQRLGMVDKNACAPVKGPHVPKREFTLWTVEQCQAFLAAAWGSRLHAFFVLAPNTGLRHGELLALHWKDIDLARGTISVQRTLVEVVGVHELAEPKTKAAYRTVSVPPPVVAALKAHRARLFEEGLSASPLVFPNRDGTLMRKKRVYEAYEALIQQTGLPRIHIHDMRHMAATLLVALGLDLKSVQTRMGHANIRTTLDLYAHSIPGSDKSAAEKLAEMTMGKKP